MEPVVSARFNALSGEVNITNLPAYCKKIFTNNIIQSFVRKTLSNAELESDTDISFTAKVSSDHKVNIKIESDDQKILLKIEINEEDLIQHQLLPCTREAYEFYAPKLPEIKQQMTTIFGSLGTIQARAKNPVSAANRLSRVVLADWGPPNGINNGQEAVKNLWDAIGSRLILSSCRPENIQKVVDVLAAAIRNGELQIRRLNNLRGPGGLPYFSDSQINQLRQADAAKNEELLKSQQTPPPPIQIGNSDRAEGSPFICVCAYIDHGDGVTGEFQLIGERVLHLADAEHLPYDTMIKKDLYRELNSEGKEKMRPYFEPFIASINALDDKQKKEYNNYLNACYIHARKVELTEAEEKDAPSLPSGFDSVLSVDTILKLHHMYVEVLATASKQGG